MKDLQGKKLVVIDNYDSFTYNLVQMFRRFPLSIEVHRSDRIQVSNVLEKRPDYLLISPGPKDPEDCGISTHLIQAAAGRFPILGVCLGMQCMNAAFGGKTIRAPLPVHGKVSRVFHEQEGIFTGVPSPFRVARYHSLAIDPTSTGVAITAWSEDGVIMGIAAPEKAMYGVQFHPESFMTEFGHILIENFLRVHPPRRRASMEKKTDRKLTAYAKPITNFSR
ncbi:MAG: aminodeoxychorismate/anthranilate synthase component II [Thermodesulfobacteriota bacterium]